MTEIDFSKIRGDSDAGRRENFEEFVCQLARLQQPNVEGCEFRRIEGSGGDGGVEAYWLCPDGTKIGYQAKYWLRAGRINWRQIDDSVRQAIQTHPDLTRYVIAIPCDLTDQTGTRPRRTGWQQWDEHVDKWKAEADEAGITNLEFEFWGESELLGMATRELPSGAIAYWFGATILDADWFEKRSKKVIKELGTRFMPDSNIDTDITRHFAVFLKQDEAFDYLENAITKFVEDWKPYIRKFKLDYPIKNKRKKIKELAENISQIEGLFSKELLRKKGWKSVRQELDKIIEKGTDDAHYLWGEVSRKLDEISDNALKDAKSDLKKLKNQLEKLKNQQNQLEKLKNQLDHLYKIARSKHFQSYDKSVFLLTGSFGTGKSHALGRLLETEVGAETPMVLFLGQQFIKGNPEQQIVGKIGIALLQTFSQFLGALNARAEACGKIGIIAIDAINEGDGIDIWFKHLEGFLGEISNFPFLKVIIACRSEFEAIVPEKVQNAAYNYDLRGFSSEDEQERALVQFMDKQGIQRPPSLILLPAFQNPLFITISCRALKAKGEKRFPDGLTGMVELIRFYLNSVGDNVARHPQSSSNLKDDIIEGISALAEEMAKRKQLDIPRKQAIQILHDKMQDPAPDNTNWLNVLSTTGCLRLDPGPSDPSNITQNSVVTFAYQSFRDYLIADALYKSLQGDNDKIFEPDGALSFMIGDDFLGARNDSVDADDTSKVDNYRINTHWRGVFMMLWVIFAEKEKRELAELLPIAVRRGDGRTLDTAFFEGLFWRSPKSITQKTTKYRGSLSESFYLASHFWAIPNHPWDAFALSEDLKQYASMAERDAEWTIFVNAHYEDRSSISKLIEWSLVQKNAPTKDVAIRIMIALGWCLSSSHKRLRDRATKALTHMLRLRPELMSELFKEFAEVNDLYIMERLLAALYGACQFVDKEHVGNVANSVYDTIFSDGKPPLHLLVRDYAQGIIERADYLNVLPKGVDLDKCTPPYKSHYPQEFQNNTPGTLYTNKAIDNLAESVGDEYKTIAESCTTESGDRMYGDFGRYALKSKVDSFCTIPISQPQPEEVKYDNKFNGELIGNWVARRVYEHHGWTSKLFPNDPRSYDRNNIIERIGKKYQRIAMYELLGILADHVYMGWSDNKAKKYTSIENLNYVRDIDPTVAAEGIEQDKRPQFHNFDVVKTLPDASADRSELEEWVFGKKVIVNDLENRIRTSADGQRWYMLHGHDSEAIIATPSARIMNTEFFHLSTNCMHEEDLPVFLEENRKMQLGRTGFSTEKDPSDLFQGKFLFEMDWRNLPTDIGYEDGLVGTKKIPYFQSVYRYVSPKENEETGRIRDLLPHPSIMVRFGLKIDPKHSNLIRNQEGEVVFYTYNKGGFQAICLIDADLFDEFLKENNLVCVWFLGGERQTFWNDTRVFGSMAWIENGKMKIEHWHEDFTLNGPR